MTEAPPDDRAARIKVKNRVALIGILTVCVVGATLGFLFAMWLRARPSGH